MTTAEILNQLRRLNATLSAENGQLIFNGPKGALTEELRAELAAHKAEIVKLLENGRIDDIGVTTSNIPRVTRDKDLPLSFAQRRLWFLDQLDPGSTVYAVAGSLRIKGPLAVEVLERSLNEIVARHEALRTTFAVKEEEEVQVIAPSLNASLSVMDITHLAEREREKEALRQLSEQADKPFDLWHGPLFRTGLVRLDENDHVLLLTLHHIVSDGWSMSVLYRELSVLYRAFVKGEPSPLADLPIQYADFAAWQRNWLSGEVLETQLSYWRKQLEGAPAVLNLPTDRPRPARQSYRGARQSIDLSLELTQGLKTLSHREGVTLYMTLLAAFQILLHRYTGQDDIVVGSPIANRNRIEIEGLIGFFVNTLVLRANFTGNPTFTALLAQVRETALDAYAHQDLPFEKLVEELRPERDLSRSPLFQAMFVFQNTPSRDVTLNGLDIRPMRIAGETTKFDLKLSANEEARRLRVGVQYDTNLFNADTIERMLGHFQNLLQGIVSNPHQHIADLSILTKVERQQILFAWNDSKTDYPKDKCIHELFETQVEKTPDAIAVTFEDERFSYRELNERANQLAHHLIELGVGTGALVGLCMERSIEMIVGLLAILKAGGAYVPLNPCYPQERLGFMVKDTEVGIILTDEASLPSLPSRNSPRLICLDRDWQKIAREPLGNLRNENTAGGLAYVIHTSGSTGVPKAVPVPHRGIVRLLFGVGYVQFDKTRTFLQMAPISFDAATFEIWGALLHGANCVLFPSEVPSPRELGYVLKRYRIDTLWLTATLFNTMIDQEPQALSTVEQLLIGGEALSVSHVRRALSLLPNTAIINGYGPTESTTFACCYAIPCQLDDNRCSIPIGKPIGNTQVYILDPHRNPVSIGVTGELHIGGDGLARGYLNQPELTREKFIANPFSHEAGARLYKTGDLARYLPDGNIDFLGRMDDQVKIRGFRIEPGEIETVLCRHPEVLESVVSAREDGIGEKSLVAYIVSGTDHDLNSGRLRDFLKEKLPEYMIPNAFVFLDSLPLTASGKVDRRALPAPDRSRPELVEAYLAPRNQTEELLTKIWTEVLKLERIGIHDNFFDLGGHSLLATRVVSRIREIFRIDLALRALFEMPTVASLSKHIETILCAGGDEHQRAIQDGVEQTEETIL